LFIRIVAALLIGIWALLVAMGKGGFVHILLLTGLGAESFDLMIICRSRMLARPE
jgi:hypothetical protein